jgi:hypothetical protein
MFVEKVDLKSLFGSLCGRYHIPPANARGWSDLNSRWSILQRIRRQVDAGKHCVILYCGDHDPAGLNISACLRKNLSELLTHAEWLQSMDRLTIDRFGLNSDCIAKHNVSWIDNLDTGSGKSLADPKHKDHNADYVQSYLREFGSRKVEANALVVRPDAGRELCRQAILKYLPEDAPDQYLAALKPHREQVRLEVIRQLQGRTATDPKTRTRTEVRCELLRSCALIRRILLPASRRNRRRSTPYLPSRGDGQLKGVAAAVISRAVALSAASSFRWSSTRLTEQTSEAA